MPFWTYRRRRPSPDQPWQIGFLCFVVVDQHKGADAEPYEQFDEDAANTAESDDGDPQLVEGNLAAVAEQSRLAVVLCVCLFWPDRRRLQPDEVVARDHDFGQHSSDTLR